MTTHELREAQILVQSPGWNVLREYLAGAEATALSTILDSPEQHHDTLLREQAIGKVNFIRNLESEFKAHILNQSTQLQPEGQ